MKTIRYHLVFPSDLLKDVMPFTPDESRRCFAKPDPEFDALAAHCATLPVAFPEE